MFIVRIDFKRAIISLYKRVISHSINTMFTFKSKSDSARRTDRTVVGDTVGSMCSERRTTALYNPYVSAYSNTLFTVHISECESISRSGPPITGYVRFNYA